jgi:hypothetical protein
MNEILEFINRRFKTDCNWLNGNCYYFALILNDRFPGGTIYYDVIYGHFIYQYKGKYYDWSGEMNPNGYLVDWSKFDEYDSLQKKHIVEGCLM